MQINEIILLAGFWYLQVLWRKAERSILPRTKLPLSSAFEGLHPTVQKAVTRTTGKTRSKDHFKGRFLKDHIFEGTLWKKVSQGPHIQRKVFEFWKSESSLRSYGQDTLEYSMVSFWSIVAVTSFAPPCRALLVEVERLLTTKVGRIEYFDSPLCKWKETALRFQPPLISLVKVHQTRWKQKRTTTSVWCSYWQHGKDVTCSKRQWVAV